MDFTFACCIFLLVVFANPISSGKLCPKDDFWFDAFTGKCRACDSCNKKSLELEPCADFRNTICVDLSNFKFHLNDAAPHKWHEMETMDDDEDQVEIRVKDIVQEKQIPSANAPAKAEDYDGWNNWQVAVFALLCAALAIVIVATILLFKHPAPFFSGNGSKRGKSRFRLFSRDRLSTTEYMNNLATLDRRLAMDEILEKRRRAIFEPQLLPENIYTDEVFIDISGIPRHYYEDLRFSESEQDPTHSLLSAEQQQNHS